MGGNKTFAWLMGILVTIYFLVIMLPMINGEITTATGVGGSLETLDGVAILVAVPTFILLIAVYGLIKGVKKG